MTEWTDSTGICDTCGEAFSDEEWENRHWGDDDEVYHDRCCPCCNDLVEGDQR